MQCLGVTWGLVRDNPSTYLKPNENTKQPSNSKSGIRY